MEKKKPNNARIQFKWFSLEITQRSRDKREKCYLSEGYLYEKFETSSGIARSCLQHSSELILHSNFEKKIQQKTVFSITELLSCVFFFSFTSKTNGIIYDDKIVCAQNREITTNQLI